jgi:hypothetical protein
MASADDIKVAVEQAIHVGLRQAIAEISARFSIRVTDIRVLWDREQAMGKPPEFRLSRIVATTESGD